MSSTDHNDLIQQRKYELLQLCGAAITALIDTIKAAKHSGATAEQLKPTLELQRTAQWRLDFIVAENSMGFHALQEAMAKAQAPPELRHTETGIRPLTSLATGVCPLIARCIG